MKRTFEFHGKGHTLITLPGATDDTKVREGDTVSVEFAEPHMAHPGYARYLSINGFREVKQERPNTAAADLSTPENGQAAKAARKKKPNAAA